MIAGLSGVSGDGVAVDPDEPLGLADAATLGDVRQQVGDLLAGQVRSEQGRALALGEAGLAGATAEHATRLSGPVTAGLGQVSGVTFAVIGTGRIQAAETGEVIHGSPPATYLAIRTRGCSYSPG
jgi:hypothetical protein